MSFLKIIKVTGVCEGNWTARGQTGLNLEEAKPVRVCRICISYTNSIEEITDLHEAAYFKAGHCWVRRRPAQPPPNPGLTGAPHCKSTPTTNQIPLQHSKITSLSLTHYQVLLHKVIVRETVRLAYYLDTAVLTLITFFWLLVEPSTIHPHRTSHPHQTSHHHRTQPNPVFQTT